MTGSGDWEMY